MQYRRNGLVWGALMALCMATAWRAFAADLADTTAADPQFKTFSAAVKAAGLTEVLKGKGPFTVFAPNDAAFAKLPKESLDALLKPENKPQLVALVNYHIVPGKFMAADISKPESGTTIATAGGQKVTLTHDTMGIRVKQSKVMVADAAADNGVIHVIDTVLMPPPPEEKAEPEKD